MRLTVKIPLILLSLTISLILIVASVVFVMTKSSIRESVKIQQIRHGQELLFIIDEEIAKHQEDLSILSKQSWAQQFVTDPESMGESARNNLSQFLLTNDYWEEIFILNRNQSNSVSTRESQINDHGNDSHNQFAIRHALGRETYISDLVISKQTGNPIMLLSAPIVDPKTSKPIGAIIGRLSWFPLLTPLNIAGTGNVRLFRNDGVFLGGNNPNEHGDILRKNFKQHDQVAFAIEQIAPTAAFLPRMIGNASAFTVVIPQSSVSDIKNRGWILTAEIPPALSLNPARTSAILFIALLSLMVLAIMGLLTITLQSLILVPLGLVSAAASEISQGNFKQSAPVNRQDEIGELDMAVNHIGREMSKLYNDMEGAIRERTKQHLESKAFNEAVIASMADCLIAVDRNGMITLVNKTFEKTTGWTTDEIRGKLLSHILQRRDGRGNAIHFEKTILPNILATKKNLNSSQYSFFQYERKDHSTFPGIGVIAPIIANNRIIGAVEVFRDITNEQELEQTKREFVSLASHQMRTPLSTNRWYAEMLLNGDAGPLNEQQRQFVKEMVDSNHRMNRLITALLNLSRIELGTFQTENTSVNIQKIVQDILKDSSEDISKKHLAIAQTWNTVHTIRTDRKLITIILQNLLTNAIAYTEQNGKIGVEAEIQKQKKQRDRLAIKITDTGVGIPKSAAKRIFTKFFRADNVRSIETQGTGLGLYLVKSLIDHHHGTISFQSSEGKGTTFVITLPIPLPIAHQSS